MSTEVKYTYIIPDGLFGLGYEPSGSFRLRLLLCGDEK